jgi:DNA-binding transcriptional ArsR family regulator
MSTGQPETWEGGGRLADAAPIFAALGDEMRLRLVARLCADGPQSISRLTAGTSVTRQAVTKHLQALAGAGLVAPTREGRETRYRPTPEPLGDAIAWMVEVGGAWDDRLGALERSARRRRAT